MRYQSWTLGLALLAWRTTAWEHVTEAKIREALDSSGYTLIASLESEWGSLQAAEKNENIVSFDCEAHLKACKDLDIVSFPAIRLYHRDGRMDRYRGKRKARLIAMFLYRALRPTVLETNGQALSSLLQLDDVVIVAHPIPDDSSLYERFKALARHYRDRFSFIVSSRLESTSVLQCHNNIDDEKHFTSEVASVQALENFVQLCSEPLIPELTRSNEQQYTTTGKSILHYFAVTDDEKERYRSEMRPLAKKYREFLHFTITDANEYSEMLPTVGLKAGSKTGLALENANTGDMFPYTGAKDIVSAVTVEKFLEDIIDGRLKPWRGGGSAARQERRHEEL
ncbi:protein disulfide-isomerase [Diplogelasinospora grovesii]|uniref:Protein disulfide-isomerase n=1 Tax=Diplogelasinospora grovesii TaxID=303347 RepID=A0AAN6NGK1_9PEZI|nr:protein disulfide-isomerase [Diplogelasinospora grovesii]